MTEAQTIFKNPTEARRYLNKIGYKVGKSKIADDAKCGLIPIKDISVEEAERYAKRARLKRQVEVSGAQMDRRAIEKLELENKHSRLKIQRLEIELAEKTGTLIPKIERDQHVAGILAVILHRMRHLAQSKSAEMIEIGSKRGPQALSDFLQELIENELDEIGSKDELEVVSVAASD
jgi:formate dehydrogenase maturation protein FdhE